jgi:hypothetical protein
MARARAWLAAQRYRWPEEPAWRRVLRIGFGVLWIIDGLLQARPAMPAGLAPQVIQPAAASSPHWVVWLVNLGIQTWSGHPVQAAASAVWIQLGIGIWLVSVSSPRWSRLAGITSAGWGLVVWVFGEAFGGTLASGASWLTGAPGAALLALPARVWRDPRIGRRILQASGGILAASAVVQAWPGSGFWQGWSAGAKGSRQPGRLASGISSMAAIPQPTPLHDLVRWFAAVVAAHGFAVNLIAVLVLAGAAACLLTGWPAIARPAAGAAIGFCLADWLLVQDLGVFGGTGTDPNSMLPQILLLTAGLLAWAEGARSDAAAAPARVSTPGAAAAPRAGYPAAAGVDYRWAARRPVVLRPVHAARRLAVAFGAASASAVLTVWAVAMLLMGAAPMALAAFDHGAAPAEAAGNKPMPALLLSSRGSPAGQTVLAYRADAQAASRAFVE